MASILFVIITKFAGPVFDIESLLREVSQGPLWVGPRLLGLDKFKRTP